MENKIDNKHSPILWAIRIVFFTMFIYSAYKRLKKALSVSYKAKEKKSFKIHSEKGILGNVKEIMKETR